MPLTSWEQELYRKRLWRPDECLETKLMPSAVHTRDEWQKLALRRISEAKILLNHYEPSGAYYLSGLGLEFGIKAVIARRFKANTWPDKDFAKKLFTHDLKELVSLSELAKELKQQSDEDSTFNRNWKLASSWSVEHRYMTWTSAEARDMVDAVVHRRHGVLTWVKRHW